MREDVVQKEYDDTVARLIAEGKSKAKAEAEALKVTLPAGQSEWSTGLLIRFANLDGGDFSQSSAYKWLSDHCVEYGFVIRYPENKTEETGITAAQPQVFRYVGVENAKKKNARPGVLRGGIRRLYQGPKVGILGGNARWTNRIC